MFSLFDEVMVLIRIFQIFIETLYLESKFFFNEEEIRSTSIIKTPKEAILLIESSQISFIYYSSE